VVAFLQEVLTNNSVTVADLEVRARAAGLLGEHQRITDAKHFKRAKAKLNIKSWRHGFGSSGAWFWSLPAQPSSQSDDKNANAAASMMRTGEVAYARTIPDPTEYIPGSPGWPARSRSSRTSPCSGCRGPGVSSICQRMPEYQHIAGAFS
jgi:hypothetical protein